VPEWELVTTKIIDYAERAIRSTAPMDVVLEALDADVDRILEKRRWMLDRRAGSKVADSVRAGAP
jgi:multiple sugar transport system substrate-binding protein